MPYYAYANNGLPTGVYYYWTSSTGNWQDLNRCQLQEVINYSCTPGYPPPVPPWETSWLTEPNPKIYNSGPFGQITTDVHHPGTLTAPFIESQVNGSQKYQFRCMCYRGGAWTDVLGPHIFNNKLHQNSNGNWIYQFYKHHQ